MPEWVLTALGYLGALGVGYAAIRADLAAIRVKAEMAVARADGAHGRIDSFLSGGMQHGSR